MGTKLKASLLHPSFERCNWVTLFQWHIITHEDIIFQIELRYFRAMCIGLMVKFMNYPTWSWVNPGGLLKLNHRRNE